MYCLKYYNSYFVPVHIMYCSVNVLYYVFIRCHYSCEALRAYENGVELYTSIIDYYYYCMCQLCSDISHS